METDAHIAPSRVIEAISVWFLPRFLGTFPYARSPLGALALRRVIEVWKPDSSTNTSLLASKRPASHRHRPRSPSSRSEATPATFFERPAPGQPRDRSPDGRRRDRHASVGLLEGLAVLLQGEVGVPLQVGRQPPFERRPLHAWSAGDGDGLDPAGLAAPLQLALDGRHRHGEGLRHLLPALAAVDRGEHPDPEVLRVRFHARRLTQDRYLC